MTYDTELQIMILYVPFSQYELYCVHFVYILQTKICFTNEK